MSSAVMDLLLVRVLGVTPRRVSLLRRIVFSVWDTGVSREEVLKSINLASFVD